MLRRLAVPFAVSALGCTTVDTATETPCGHLSGGALVTLDVVAEAVTLWITDPGFLAEARAVEGSPTPSTRVPVFDQVIPGSTCDAGWSWHVDPADVDWEDAAGVAARCDALPSDIEADLFGWMMQVGGWCPWEARVIEVLDLR